MEGLLLAAPPAALGPATRASVGFILRTPGADHPVYAGGTEDMLGRLEGRWVRIRGKLVDLSSEGHGVELWIGSFEEPRASGKRAEGPK